MQIIDKNDELFLDLNRFVSLEKKNPKLLGKIIQKRLDIGLAEVYQKHKSAGVPVTYYDQDYPDCLIREDADGRRFIINVNLENGYQEIVVREISPRRQVA